MSPKKRTILLFGRSGSGKSTQIGVMAEWVYNKTGLPTRLYTADRGGLDPMMPHIEAGIIEVVEMGNTDPFIFLNKACKGEVRDATGKWIQSTTPIGMYAFESMRSFAEALMAVMTSKVAAGQNIGGSANINFAVSDGVENLKISGSNMAMFGVTQARITEEVWASQRLDAPYILWTSSISKDDDQVSAGKILGPEVIGKALTGEVPRWFQLSFRIDQRPAQAGQPEKHILFLGSSVDALAGNATVLGNLRLPIDAPPIPATLEPASLPKAIELIDDAFSKSADKLKLRMSTAAKKV